MKKWSLFSMPLSLILAIASFITVPLVQTVHADGNITGNARLRLENCKPSGDKKCSRLVLNYSLSSLKPDSVSTRVGVYRNGCNSGSVIIEKKVLPIGDGEDSRTVKESASFKTLKGPLLVFCFFRGDSLKARGEFKVEGDGLSASAEVKTSPEDQLAKDKKATRGQSSGALTLKCSGNNNNKGCLSSNDNTLTLRYNLVSNLRTDNTRAGTAGVYKGSCMGKNSADLQAVIDSPVTTIRDGNERRMVSKELNIKRIPNNENWHFCLFLSDSTSSGEYVAGQGKFKVENSGLKATTVPFSVVFCRKCQ